MFEKDGSINKCYFFSLNTFHLIKNSKIKDGIIYFLINKKNELRILIKSIHLKKEKIKVNLKNK